MKHLLLGLCYIITNTLFAQKTLSGKVLSAVDNKPIASASIYLSNTAIGTVSQVDGSFTINSFPEGQYNIVVSSLGYETVINPINATELPKHLTITLNQKVKQLNDLTVEPYVKDGWKIWGDFFMEYIVGQTPNAKECKLLNKEAVRFRIKQINLSQRILEAVTTESLVIENKALGYVLTYDLELFRINLSDYSYTYYGYPLFTEMKAPNAKTKQKWLSNREEAYQGSMMHFMRSLYRNELAQEGFIIKRIVRKLPTTGPATEKADSVYLTGNSIARSININTVQLQFTDVLEVVYPAKQATAAYIDAETYPTVPPETYHDIPEIGKMSPTSIQNLMLHPSIAIGQPLTAQLSLRYVDQSVQVLYNGQYTDSKNVTPMLYWGWSEKLSNLLPLNYGNPVPVNAEQVYKTK